MRELIQTFSACGRERISEGRCTDEVGYYGVKVETKREASSRLVLTAVSWRKLTKESRD